MLWILRCIIDSILDSAMVIVGWWHRKRIRSLTAGQMKLVSGISKVSGSGVRKAERRVK